MPGKTAYTASSGGHAARGIRPGSEPLRLTIPAERIASARIRGRVLGPSGEAVSDAFLSLLLIRVDGTVEGANEPARRDGTFLTRRLLPGRYLVSIRSNDHGNLYLQDCELVPGQILDLGIHHFQAPGSLELRLFDARGEPIPHGMLHIQFPQQSWSLGVTVEHGSLLQKALQPGRYTLSSDGSGLPLFAIEVDIQPGERTETELQVPAGVRRKFLLPATGRGSMVRQIWRDSGDLVISDFTRSGSDNPREVEMLLPPGTCSVEVIDATGASARRRFVIDYGEELDEVLELPRPRG